MGGELLPSRGKGLINTNLALISVSIYGPVFGGPPSPDPYMYNVGKTTINHSPNHHFYRWYGYHSHMCGLWHGFTHIMYISSTYPLRRQRHHGTPPGCVQRSLPGRPLPRTHGVCVEPWGDPWTQLKWSMYGLCMIYVWSKYDLCMEKYGNIGHMENGWMGNQWNTHMRNSWTNICRNTWQRYRIIRNVYGKYTSHILEIHGGKSCHMVFSPSKWWDNWAQDPK